MPTVPRTEVGPANIRALSPQRLQRDVSAGNELDVIGEAFNTLGTVMEQRAKSQIERDDTAAVLTALNASSDQWRAFEMESSAQQGSELFDLTERAKSVLAEARQKGGEGLSPNQRAAYDALWLRQSEGRLDAVSKRESAARTEFSITAARTAAEDAGELAVANPDAYSGSVEVGKAALRSTMTGMPAGVVDSVTRNYVAGVNAQIIDRLIANGDWQGAEQWLSTHGAELDADPDASTSARAKVATHVSLGKAQGEADRIWGSSRDQSERLRLVREITDPDVREKAGQIVKTRWADGIAIEREKRDESANSAMNDINEGLRQGVDRDQLFAIANGLDDAKSRTAARQLVEQGGYPAYSDLAYKSELHRMAAGTPDQRARFVEMNLHADTFGRLSRGDTEALATMQAAILSKAAEAPPITSPYTTFEQFVGQVVDIKAKPGSDDGKALFAMRTEFEAQLYQARIDLGREPTPDEVNKLVGGVILRWDRANPTMFFGRDLPTPGLPDDTVIPVSERPKSHRDEVRRRLSEAYRRRGDVAPVIPESVVDQWLLANPRWQPGSESELPPQ